MTKHLDFAQLIAARPAPLRSHIPPTTTQQVFDAISDLACQAWVDGLIPLETLAHFSFGPPVRRDVVRITGKHPALAAPYGVSRPAARRL